MTPDGSVTHQISKLKAGDHAAARILWQHYFQRLIRLASRKLDAKTRRVADGEDLALAAFASFCRHAEQGRLPNVLDRDDMWNLLVTLTVRLAIDMVRREGRKKRGGKATHDAGGSAPAQLESRQSDPAFVAQVAEESDRLLGALDDETLKTIAIWKTDGYTNEEIAVKLGVVLRTVERKLHTIRKRWAPTDQPPDATKRASR